MTPHGIMDLLCVGAINKTDMMVPAPCPVSKTSNTETESQT